VNELTIIHQDQRGSHRKRHRACREQLATRYRWWWRPSTGNCGMGWFACDSTHLLFVFSHAERKTNNKRSRTYAVGMLSLRQRGTLHFNVCGFSARSAEKPHTNDQHVPCCRRQKVRLWDAEQRNCV